MIFPGFDLSRVSRMLAHLETRPDDMVDAFFERTEDVEASSSGSAPRVRTRREEGFALRLANRRETWAASRDHLSPDLFSSSFRQVARRMPQAGIVTSDLEFGEWVDGFQNEELLSYPERLRQALQQRRVGFPHDVVVCRHSRWLQVVGAQLAPEPESESFFSVVVQLPGGRYGTLLSRLDEMDDQLLHAVIEIFRSRDAEPVGPGSRVVVLGPAAAAVFLHEAVAHSLEADVLAASGDPRAAIGLELGSQVLDLLDDPGAAPSSVRRRTDDEGIPVIRRWLLRAGRVEQLLSDRLWSERLDGVAPGSGRRGSRHQIPGPRSTNLELLPGSESQRDLLSQAEGGLFVEVATRGRLDPLSGSFWIESPCARRITSDGLAERVGPCRLQGRVGELLRAVTAVGEVAERGGAGWCAKSDHRLPVWAKTPGLRLEGVDVRPTASSR